MQEIPLTKKACDHSDKQKYSITVKCKQCDYECSLVYYSMDPAIPIKLACIKSTSKPIQKWEIYRIELSYRWMENF